MQMLAGTTRVGLATVLAYAAFGCAAGAGTQEGGPAAAARQAAAPEKFADGVISDARQQWRISFAPDGRTAWFTSSDGFFPVTRKATIYVSRLDAGGWTTPQVAPFSGEHPDIDPHVTPDGRRLYFSSIRPVDGTTRGDLDIWYVERTGDGWGAPVRLGDEVNSPADELYASSQRDGTLWFASGPGAPRAGAHWDIYRAERRGSGFAPRVALPAEINTQPREGGGLQDAWEFNPEISPDGRTLVFASLRPGGLGLGDLWVSRLRDGRWTPARNLGAPVNSAADEYHPTFSPDGRDLYFVRRVAGNGDFYRIPLSAIGLR